MIKTKKYLFIILTSMMLIEGCFLEDRPRVSGNIKAPYEYGYFTLNVKNTLTGEDFFPDEGFWVCVGDYVWSADNVCPPGEYAATLVNNLSTNIDLFYPQYLPVTKSVILETNPFFLPWQMELDFEVEYDTSYQYLTLPIYASDGTAVNSINFEGRPGYNISFLDIDTNLSLENYDGSWSVTPLVLRTQNCLGHQIKVTINIEGYQEVIQTFTLIYDVNTYPYDCNKAEIHLQAN